MGSSQELLEDGEIGSLEDLTKRVQPFRKNGYWIFRGVRDHTYELKPKIGRDGSRKSLSTGEDKPLFQIADEVGRLLNLPVDKVSVRKSKATPELKNVDMAKRLELLGGAHSVESDAVRGRRVLLLDDLYQSGATLNAIGRLLKESGGVSRSLSDLAPTNSLCKTPARSRE